MKRINHKSISLALGLFLMIVTPTNLSARIFHGPYAGLHAFYHMNNMKSRHTKSVTVPQKFKTETMSVGAHGGYGRTFENRIFAGFDAYLSYDNISKLNKDYSVEQNGVQVSAKLKINRSVSFGMDGRLGYNLERFVPAGAIVYGGATVVASRYTVGGSLTEIGGVGKTKSEFLYGFGPVMGGEMRLQRTLAIGVNYKFHVYGQKKFNQLTLRPKVNSFQGYLTYYF